MLNDGGGRRSGTAWPGRGPLASALDLRLDVIGRGRWRIVDVRRSERGAPVVIGSVAQTEAGYELTLAATPGRRLWCTDLSSALDTVVRASWNRR
ncbi:MULTISPECIES: hypothetical protein [Frigoribacterium]|jgi:hypothetical protein|uniref:hypothetical protein n=1 Tax=Frigoribacterium TaxID=96492 RepID=UPI0006FE816A|nr:MULTISPECIES: hypothetical protein [Frigoribacterium]KQM29758.1 hypothetical protein ASL10_03785 [Frigoribacterium sp. Leaf8]MBD8141063.1 hypothetical protein [Frigoribacterium sp. CFBP 13605]MBD8487105.1 hypothetical protein [Frigoribacterium sp. CFBP 8759]NQW87405.1 hypothetical protein [Frigoribacterium sp. VKM Ac-2860]NQX09786.1 hypothetical protein [Frigoribacterium sp. VKM Ac-2859]